MIDTLDAVNSGAYVPATMSDTTAVTAVTTTPAKAAATLGPVRFTRLNRDADEELLRRAKADDRSPAYIIRKIVERAMRRRPR